MLECVVNISEGANKDTLLELARSCAPSLLDVHSDPHHNRSVFTLAGPHVEIDARQLAVAAFELLHIDHHDGVHPRIGIIDVVPFVPLSGSNMAAAIEARNSFADWLVNALNVPAFLYGPERSLPDVRKGAFSNLVPLGPGEPHPRAGACAVGARPVLIAFNMILRSADMEKAKIIASSVRSGSLRTLALQIGDEIQVSCNLVDPATVGPAAAYAAVCSRAPVDRCELVGLLPRAVLLQQPEHLWDTLDISDDKTIEARLDRDGLR